MVQHEEEHGMTRQRIGTLVGILALSLAMTACENQAQQPAPQAQPQAQKAPQPAPNTAPAPTPIKVPPPSIDYDKLAGAIAAQIDTDKIADKVVEKIKAEKLLAPAPVKVAEVGKRPERPERPERPDAAKRPEAKKGDDKKKRQPRPVPKTVWKASLRGDEAFKGAADALVTIVEFSDFECPFCGRVEPTIDQILETYGDKVKVVWKDNPLSFHKNARPASLAACAANKQGKFWEMHKTLFANQRALTKEDLNGYAKEIGLDMGKFETDFNGPVCAAAVDGDQKLANDVGARGTPNLYINGRQVRGAVPFEHIEPVLKEEIKKAEELIAKGTPKDKVYEEIIKTGKLFKPLADEVQTWAAKAPFKGKADGEIVVTMYSDFQCPYCSRIKKPIYDLMAEYPDNIKVEFRHFPLSFHKDAHLAAQASMAADAQGKFWEMHDKLFDNQKALKREDLDKYATEIGLDMAAFKKALDEGTFKDLVDQHFSEGQKTGVRGTPSIFINGRKFEAPSRDVATFKKLIDSEILKK
jgi:protein-disulfide isomerase